MVRKTLIPILFLAACTNTTPWILDSISAGDTRFDSSRLIYQNTQTPIRLEILKIGDAVDLVLSLIQFEITPTEENPAVATVRFSIDNESPFEERAPLCLGNMRLRLSEKTASKVIKALQEGKKIEICIDDVTETVYPESFAKTYEKFQNAHSFRNPFN